MLVGGGGGVINKINNKMQVCLKGMGSISTFLIVSQVGSSIFRFFFRDGERKFYSFLQFCTNCVRTCINIYIHRNKKKFFLFCNLTFKYLETLRGERKYKNL